MGEGDINRGLARPSVAGRARVSFACDADKIVRLVDLEQRDPLKILFPDPLDEPQPVAVLVNTGGGIVGGDSLEIEVEIGAGATALVTAQAAEKIYRAWGPSAHTSNALSVGEAARLEWLAQETILVFGRRARAPRRSARSPSRGRLWTSRGRRSTGRRTPGRGSSTGCWSGASSIRIRRGCGGTMRGCGARCVPGFGTCRGVCPGFGSFDAGIARGETA